MSGIGACLDRDFAVGCSEVIYVSLHFKPNRGRSHGGCDLQDRFTQARKIVSRDSPDAEDDEQDLLHITAAP